MYSMITAKCSLYSSWYDGTYDGTMHVIHAEVAEQSIAFNTACIVNYTATIHTILYCL